MYWVSGIPTGMGFYADIVTELNHVMERDINLLSGGELQRFAIGTVCVQKADVYALRFHQ